MAIHLGGIVNDYTPVIPTLWRPQGKHSSRIQSNFPFGFLLSFEQSNKNPNVSLFWQTIAAEAPKLANPS